MKPESPRVPLIRQPSALLPLAMSLAGLLLVVGHALVYGVVREADEGVVVRIFWLLMGLQLPVLAYFALKWLPRQPRQALQVLVLLAVAWLVPWIGVYFLT